MTTLIVSVFFGVSTFAYDIEVDGLYYSVIKKAQRATVVGVSKTLTEAIIPDKIVFEDLECNVVAIDDLAFMQGSEHLKKVVIGNNVEKIGIYAFEFTKIKSITIPKSVKEIDTDAFRDCDSLEAVYIEDISAWCNISFSKTKSNPLYFAKNLYLNNELVTDLVIPDDVTEIKDYSFTNASCIKTLSIPDHISNIGEASFYNCIGLTNVKLPYNLETIGRNAFESCSSLTSVEIPDKVKTIGYAAFYNCKNMENVKMPNSLETLGDEAFRYCEKLKSISINGTIKNIPYRCFEYCKSLTTVSIPSSIVNLKDYCFAYCKELTDITCYAESAPSASYTYSFIDSSPEYATLHVPSTSIESYQNTRTWSQFGSIVAITEPGIETPKCSTPNVTFTDGKLQFICDTEGAKCYYTLSNSDVKNNDTLVEGNSVIFDACYNISFYAIADGYTNSDTATAKLYWLTSSGTLEGDNINNISMRGIAIQSTGGFINISGLDNNEKVSFYGLDGKALGYATAINGTTSFSAQSGTVVVAKIGKESIKIAVE